MVDEAVDIVAVQEAVIVMAVGVEVEVVAVAVAVLMKETHGIDSALDQVVAMTRVVIAVLLLKDSH